MSISAAQKKWIKMIHIAKSQTGTDDNAYRAILGSCAGVESSSEIKTWEQYNSVMTAFKKLGFKTIRKDVSSNGKNPEWISTAQESYIRGLWQLVAVNKEYKYLRHFITRITGVEDITWLKRKDASKVIVALRQMALDSGINPDRKN